MKHEVRLERIVKRFYDELENGKFMARKCKACGAIEFPPLSVCNSCPSTDMEWVEISGIGEVMDFALPGANANTDEYEPLRPFVYASIKMEDGGREINALVLGINKKNEMEYRGKLPFKVQAGTFDREGYKQMIFNITE